ncbi:hypothetical protein [Ornithinimicrobium tianjinense]|uniref:Lipoprotein n=1 Tax=Ornithinimicrobium tianjinense TaxID=1195761 RepID=A0A917BPM9_9MICO|nr:hypothetical protein [Ornithinimicrobium tianjinense]GGF54100.1 hypothetical protein GCM10011366_22420 [Ornithinimicrobium tianjinense]
MHQSRRPRPDAALLPALALALSACGGDEAGADPAAAVPVQLSTSAPAAPSDTDDEDEAETTADDAAATTGPAGEPDTWATFTEEPGQLPPADGATAFADDPRVLAVREFNAEFARAASENDPQRAAWLATLDPAGYEDLMAMLSEEFGKQYPGPLPMTVVDVAELEDGTGSVQGCIISEGFATGGEGYTGSTITSVEYALVPDPSEEGSWLVQKIWAGAYDCSSVDVEATAW